MRDFSFHFLLALVVNWDAVLLRAQEKEKETELQSIQGIYQITIYENLMS